MQPVRLGVGLSAVALLVAPAAGTRASEAPAERFAGVDLGGGLVTFTQPGGVTSRLTITGRPDVGLRTIGLDTLPTGGVVGLEADGRVFDLDITTGRATMRFDARRVASRYAIEGRSTFSIGPDGSSAIVASVRGAERIDLGTGASTPLAPLRYAAGDPLAAVVPAPALDTLPTGGLVGVEAAGPAVVSATIAAGLTVIGGFPVEMHGPTRFTLDPGGRVGWLSTRALGRRVGRCTRLVKVNSATGATDLPASVTLPECLDAITALGPASVDEPVAAPEGAPAPRSAQPPPRFHTFVNLGLTGRQSVRGILRRGGLAMSPASNGPATITVIARLRGSVVARSRLSVDAVPVDRSRLDSHVPPRRRLVRLVPGASRRLRGSGGDRLDLTIELRDSGGRVRNQRTVTLGS